MSYEPAPGLIEEMIRALGLFEWLCLPLLLVNGWFLFRLRARWIRESVHRRGRDPIRSYWDLHRPEIRHAIWNDRDIRGAASAQGCLLLIVLLRSVWQSIEKML